MISLLDGRNSYQVTLVASQATKRPPWGGTIIRLTSRSFSGDSLSFSPRVCASTFREITVRFVRGVSFQLAADSGIASWKFTPLISRTVLRVRDRQPTTARRELAGGSRSVSERHLACRVLVHRRETKHDPARRRMFAGDTLRQKAVLEFLARHGRAMFDQRQTPSALRRIRSAVEHSRTGV